MDNPRSDNGQTSGRGSEEDQNCLFARRKEEFSAEGGCLLWGMRVNVPPQLCTKVIDEIHEGHPGISHMKSFAISYVWCSGIDVDLENKVQQCLMSTELEGTTEGSYMRMARETMDKVSSGSCRAN